MAKKGELLLTYALNAENELVSIANISARGMECNCRCPKCKDRLVAKLGNGGRKPHFAHQKDSDCHGSYMTALHMLAEKILIEKRTVMAPPYKIIPSKRLSFCSMEREIRSERKDLQPDVVGITEEGWRFHVEIKNTHEVDEDKKKKIIESNITCLEIDVSKQKLDELENFLLNSDHEREWINNPIYDNQITIIKRERLLEEVDSLYKYAFNEVLRIEHFDKEFVSPDGLFQRLKGTTPNNTSYYFNVGYEDSLRQYLDQIEEQDECCEINIFVSVTRGYSKIRWEKDYNIIKRIRVSKEVDNLGKHPFNEDLKIEHFDKVFVSDDGFFQRLIGKTPNGTQYYFNVGFEDSLRRYLNLINEQYECCEINVIVNIGGTESKIEWEKDDEDLKQRETTSSQHEDNDSSSNSDSISEIEPSPDSLLHDFYWYLKDQMKTPQVEGFQIHLLEYPTNSPWILLLYYDYKKEHFHLYKYYEKDGAIQPRKIGEYETRESAVSAFWRMLQPNNGLNNGQLRR